MLKKSYISAEGRYQSYWYQRRCSCLEQYAVVVKGDKVGSNDYLDHSLLLRERIVIHALVKYMSNLDIGSRTRRPLHHHFPLRLPNRFPVNSMTDKAARDVKYHSICNDSNPARLLRMNHAPTTVPLLRRPPHRGSQNKSSPKFGSDQLAPRRRHTPKQTCCCDARDERVPVNRPIVLQRPYEIVAVDEDDAECYNQEQRSEWLLLESICSRRGFIIVVNRWGFSLQYNFGHRAQ